jgi:LAO/AO transport system kinase
VTTSELSGTYVEGVRAGDRSMIARTITLMESSRPAHRDLARAVLAELAPLAGNSRRIGITGVPGAGKSTLIEALGLKLIADGHQVAVLAIDPSSARTGGSILGDRTRMPGLAADPRAFVRPSPSGGTLGGVATATGEAMLVLEAAGFDVVLVETVGVGQSEFMVADLVDSFLFLTLARTGDQLQGMKRGILELADVIAVNKADGTHTEDARRAARELSGALRLVRGAEGSWQPPVLTCSALEHTGLDELWSKLEAHRAHLGDGLALKRRQQQISWSRRIVADALLSVTEAPRVRRASAEIEAALLAGGLTAMQAAEQILAVIRAQ